MSFNPVTGSLVRVITSGADLDPNTYRLDGYEGQKALVTCVSTNVQSSIHRSRVIQADEGKTEEQIMSDVDKKASKAPKVKAVGSAPKKTAERIPFDFAAEIATMGDGAEHWRKTNSFDHDSITSEAHVLISGDKTWFRSLNTYDGSLGKNAHTGQKYDIKDYDKKIKELQARSYTLVATPISATV